MKNSQIAAWLLAAALVGLHALVLIRAFSPMRDPNGYDTMVVFFFGVPLAITTAVVSAVALKKTKAGSLWVPLAVGLLPVIGWPALFALEALRIVP